MDEAAAMKNYLSEAADTEDEWFYSEISGKALPRDIMKVFLNILLGILF